MVVAFSGRWMSNFELWTSNIQ